MCISSDDERHIRIRGEQLKLVDKVRVGNERYFLDVYPCTLTARR